MFSSAIVQFTVCQRVSVGQLLETNETETKNRLPCGTSTSRGKKVCFTTLTHSLPKMPGAFVLYPSIERRAVVHQDTPVHTLMYTKLVKSRRDRITCVRLSQRGNPLIIPLMFCLGCLTLFQPTGVQPGNQQPQISCVSLAL